MMSGDIGTSPVADLPGRDRAALRSAWEKTFGSPPLPHLSTGFLRRALAHERQCRAFGGLDTATRRALAAALEDPRREDAGPGRQPRAASVRTGVGAQLIREWNGRTYRVEVLEDGYRFDGRAWRSLSAIARHITGANWSGPRFFGLAGRREG